jgi:hypothetical protein
MQVVIEKGLWLWRWSSRFRTEEQQAFQSSRNGEGLSIPDEHCTDAGAILVWQQQRILAVPLYPVSGFVSDAIGLVEGKLRCCC